MKFEVIDMRLRFKFLTRSIRNVPEINEFKLYHINLFDANRWETFIGVPLPFYIRYVRVWTNAFVFPLLLRDISVTSGRRESLARSPPVIEETGWKLRIVDRRVRERRRAMDFMLLLLVMLLRQEGECFHLRELLRFRAHERTSVSRVRVLVPSLYPL